MARLSCSFPHTLGQETALTRMKTLIPKIKREQSDKVTNISERWSGKTGNFSFNAQGFNISGTTTVDSARVTVICDVSDLAKGTLKRTLEREVGALLRA